jgi:CRP-like cAMP-binding protein
MEDRKQLLAKLDLFAGLDDRDLSEIAKITKRHRLHAGEALFHKGDEGGDMYVIVSGLVRAFSTGPDGDDVVFRLMGSGDVTGELALFVDGKRSASNVALLECELLMIQRRDLLPLLRRCPEMALRLISALAARTIRLSEALEDKRLLPVRARLAKCLLELANRWHAPGKSGGVRIELRLPQGELADLIGATRESVNKLVRRWRASGVIETSGDRSITIKDRAALERLAEA